MKITILGCGSSSGVPLLSGFWGACNPDNPKNHRQRSSVLIEHGDKNILIDTSPDLRQQILKAGVDHIDAVLYTHDHADHIYGLPELRPLLYTRKQSIPLYGKKDILEALKQAFSYAFVPTNDIYPPFVIPEEISGPFTLFDLPITPFDQDHITTFSQGYRIGNMAYSTDFKTIPESSLALLKGLDLWIVDCLQYTPAPTHSHFDATMDLIDKVRPKKAILIHMNCSMDYDVLLSKCPPNVEPAYDGMVIDLN